MVTSKQNLKDVDKMLKSLEAKWEELSDEAELLQLEEEIYKAQQLWSKLKIKAGEKPQVSVIMSVYNTEKYVGKAIKSVLDQTFSDFEIILIDDGSADSSIEIVKQLKDPRIRIVRQTNHGLVYSFNKAVSLARADFLARMDADDITLPSRFEKEIAWLKADKHRGLVGTYFSYIDEETSKPLDVVMDPPFKHLDIARLMYIVNPFGHGSIMMRKDAVAQAGGYHAEYEPSEDYDLWRRIAKDWQIGMIPEVLYLWRFHPGSISRRKSEISNASAARTVENMWQAKPINKSAVQIIVDSKFYQSQAHPDSEKIYATYIDQQVRLARQFLRRGKLIAGYNTALALCWLDRHYIRVLWRLMLFAPVKYIKGLFR